MLAERLGWAYVEADDHHPPANVAKMRRGEPLDDEDRAPWLASLRAELDRRLDAGEGVVLSSSALKAAYRRVLTEGRPEVATVVLHGPPRLLADRLNARTGHFFDPKLLETQLRTLELPGPGEAPLVVGIEPDPERVADRIVRDLGLSGHDRSTGPSTSPSADPREPPEPSEAPEPPG